MGTKKSRKHLRAVISPAIMALGAPEQSPTLDQVVSESEAAAIIGYSKDTLRREFKAGRTPAGSRGEEAQRHRGCRDGRRNPQPRKRDPGRALAAGPSAAG